MVLLWETFRGPGLTYSGLWNNRLVKIIESGKTSRRPTDNKSNTAAPLLLVFGELRFGLVNWWLTALSAQTGHRAMGV